MTTEQRTSIAIIFVAALATTGIVAACADGPIAPPSIGPLAVSPAHQWAGGAVTVEADGLGDAPALSVLVNGEPYPESLTEPLGDSLRVRLPATANGPVDIVARSGERTLGRTTVETYGFERTQNYPVRLVKYVKPWPLAAGFGLVGIYELPGQDNGGVAVLELGSGAVTQFDSLHAPQCRVPMLGTEPERIIVCRTLNEVPAHEYRLAAEPEFERDLPFGLTRFYNALLSPGVGLNGNHHSVSTFTFDDTSATGVANVQTEEIHGVEVLTHHDRAMIESNSVSVPVLEASTGQLAYVLDSDVAIASRSVASSETRGLFYVIAYTPSRYRLLAVEAVAGSVRDSLAYAGGEGRGWDEVEYEPERDIVLLSVPLAERLLVLDAGTLTTIGTIDLAGRFPERWWDSEIFVDSEAGRGFLIFTETESEQSTPAIEFRLPPAGSRAD